MTNFFDLTLKELEGLIESLGIKSYRARQIYKWVYQSDLTDFNLMTNLPKGLRVTLKNMFYFGIPEVRETQTSEDSSVKFMFATSDNRLVESVFMPEDDRSTLCVSTQIGCKMSCAFCVTSKIGFVRDLTAGEIVGQVMAVRNHMGRSGITNIVLMGMGEPLDNIDNVLTAIEILEEPFGLKISHRRLTISTVGLVDRLRLIDPRKAQLAISLNAATDAVRTRLMPINRVYPLGDVLAYVKGLGDMGRIRITFEYVMLQGVNDSLEDAKQLAGLLAGIKCKINLIPYNASPYTEFKTPHPESVKDFQSYLINKHFTAIVRASRAGDIGGGCGQLGMRYLEEGRA
jgi:23S rRNA (adenine2503-C2)-methyltransferase